MCNLGWKKKQIFWKLMLAHPSKVAFGHPDCKSTQKNILKSPGEVADFHVYVVKIAKT